MTIESVIKLIKCQTSAKIKETFCGELIGIGTFRDVYEMKGHPNYVVKVEQEPKLRAFANVTEYRNWQDNKEWLLGKWMAPILFISQDGEVLIQRRAEFKEKGHPKKIPAFFTDIKIQNFGWIDGKCVCIDYSSLLLHSGTKMMRTVRKWRDTGHRPITSNKNYKSSHK